jgi:hypothetical protein
MRSILIRNIEFEDQAHACALYLRSHFPVWMFGYVYEPGIGWIVFVVDESPLLDTGILNTAAGFAEGWMAGYEYRGREEEANQ